MVDWSVGVGKYDGESKKQEFERVIKERVE